MLDKAKYSAFESMLNSSIVSYRIVSQNLNISFNTLCRQHNVGIVGEAGGRAVRGFDRRNSCL